MTALIVLEASKSHGVRLKVELGVSSLGWLWAIFR